MCVCLRVWETERQRKMFICVSSHLNVCMLVCVCLCVYKHTYLHPHLCGCVSSFLYHCPPQNLHLCNACGYNCLFSRFSSVGHTDWQVSPKVGFHLHCNALTLSALQHYRAHVVNVFLFIYLMSGNSSTGPETSVFRKKNGRRNPLKMRPNDSFPLFLNIKIRFMTTCLCFRIGSHCCLLMVMMWKNQELHNVH